MPVWSKRCATTVRLHPLVREFASRRTPPGEAAAFHCTCAERLATAYEDVATLEGLARTRGLDAMQDDLIATLDAFCRIAPMADVSSRLQALLRLLRREAH